MCTNDVSAAWLTTRRLLSQGLKKNWYPFSFTIFISPSLTRNMRSQSYGTSVVPLDNKLQFLDVKIEFLLEHVCWCFSPRARKRLLNFNYSTTILGLWSLELLPTAILDLWRMTPSCLVCILRWKNGAFIKQHCRTVGRPTGFQCILVCYV